MDYSILFGFGDSSGTALCQCGSTYGHILDCFLCFLCGFYCIIQCGNGLINSACLFGCRLFVRSVGSEFVGNTELVDRASKVGADMIEESKDVLAARNELTRDKHSVRVANHGHGAARMLIVGKIDLIRSRQFQTLDLQI